MNKKNMELELDNHGERLVPGYSHDPIEIVRHRSTYQLFRKIIERDILNDPDMLRRPIAVLDLGCGTGHGTFMIAQIPGTRVEGVDISADSIAFACADYEQENIQYIVADADTLPIDKTYDYVVSRHAIEHIAQAIPVMKSLKFTKRLLLSVPYKEGEGNPFHLHNDIDENFFGFFPDPEFIYEDLKGISDVRPFEDRITNSFTCVVSRPGLPRVTQELPFPMAAYEYKGLEKIFIAGEIMTLQLENARLRKVARWLKRRLTIKTQDLTANMAEAKGLRGQLQAMQAQSETVQAQYKLLEQSWGARFQRTVERWRARMGM